MLISSHNDIPDRSAGFSLLEVLVVLSIMALMLSVVSVRLVRTIESTYFNRTADALVADVILFRAEAVLSRQSRTLVTDSSRLKPVNDLEKKTIRRFNLPEGWKVSGEAIKITQTGTCFGGEIVIADNEGRRASYRLTPPKCAPIRF